MGQGEEEQGQEEGEREARQQPVFRSAASWLAEAAAADAFGCRHVILTTSGTTAIQTALVALGVCEGDEVITYTCDLDLGDYIKNTIFNFEKHRRIEHYGLITERTGLVPPKDP